MLTLFFDSETTGLPDYKAPSESEHQPHIVQLAAELVDDETREVMASMDVTIRPDGWTIPQETSELHGITNELAERIGIPERTAVSMFLQLASAADQRSGHNIVGFDNRIVRIAIKRLGYAEAEAMAEDWKAMPSIDTCHAARKVVTGSAKLVDAHAEIVGETFAKAHTAMADCQAARRLFFALRDQGVL